MPKRIYIKTVSPADIASSNVTLEDDAEPFAIVLNSSGMIEIFFYIVE